MKSIKYAAIVALLLVTSLASTQQNSSEQPSLLSNINLVDILNTGVTGFAFLMLFLGYKLTSNVQNKILEKDHSTFKDIESQKEWSKLVTTQIHNTRYFILFSLLFFAGGLFLLVFSQENEITVQINPFQNNEITPTVTHQGQSVQFNQSGVSKIKVKNDQFIQLSIYDLIQKLNELTFILEDKNKSELKSILNNTNVNPNNINLNSWSELNNSFEVAKRNGDTNKLRDISINRGVLAFSEGNLVNAKEHFTSNWARNTETSNQFISLINNQEQINQINSHIAKGVSHILKDNPQNALKEYELALAINPSHARALEYKGYALLLLKNYESSLAASKQANQAEPHQINIILNILKANCALNNTEEIKRTIRTNRKTLVDHREKINNDSQINNLCGEQVLKHL